jgi:microcystin-dependent protein
MSNYEATKYDYDGANLTGIQGLATGTIVPWTDTSLPSGFLECNGAAVSRSTYAALFAVVSTTYGSGNGSTTFNLPDLKDNLAVGRSNSKALASSGGANTVQTTGNIGGSTAAHTLTTPEIASHSHPGSISPSNQKTQAAGVVQIGASGGTMSGAGAGGTHSHNMSATFTGDSTSVLQPYVAMIYVIKT